MLSHHVLFPVSLRVTVSPCLLARRSSRSGNPVDPKSRLIWESTDDPAYQLDENTLAVRPLCLFTPFPCTKPQKPLPFPDVSVPYSKFNMSNYSVAVSGDVFRWVVDYGSEEVLNRVRVQLIMSGYRD